MGRQNVNHGSLPLLGDALLKAPERETHRADVGVGRRGKDTTRCSPERIAVEPLCLLHRRGLRAKTMDGGISGARPFLSGLGSLAFHWQTGDGCLGCRNWRGPFRSSLQPAGQIETHPR